jgi:hypothetical protein
MNQLHEAPAPARQAQSAKSDEALNSAKRRRVSYGVVIASELIGIAIRLVPAIKPPNFAPVGATGLLGGARLPFWVIIPLQIIAAVVVDTVLWKGFHLKPFNFAVYASFVLYALLGRALLKGNDRFSRIAGVTFLASLQFFLITNFQVWYAGIGEPGQMYEANLPGLLMCYAKALPFFGWTLASDLGFTAVLFGAEAWVYGMLFAAKPAEQTEETSA